MNTKLFFFKILCTYIFCLKSIHAAEDNNFYLTVKEWDNKKQIDTNFSPEKNSATKIRNKSIEFFSLPLSTNLTIPVKFYNRRSDRLIVAAQALPASKRSMEIFSELFPEYDIVTFDYRWNDNYEWFLCKSIFACKPVQSVLLDEIEELRTVVTHTINRKKYKTVVGLGQCYSCFHLAQLQAESKPFTHLIFDSCWHSVKSFAERICFDPYLPSSPQEGGAPTILSNITNNAAFKNITLGSLFSMLSNPSINQFLPQINIPLLYIYGKNDRFVPEETFQQIWNATNESQRTLLLTPFQHCNNLENEMVYQAIADLFIRSSTLEDFLQSVQEQLFSNVDQASFFDE